MANKAGKKAKTKAKVNDLRTETFKKNLYAGRCAEIVEQCQGCSRIVEEDGKKYCAVYPQPASKWRKDVCNFATHAKKELPKDESGKKINPLKAAKRAARGH